MKKFRKSVPEWRDRFLAEKNKEIIALLNDGEKSPTDQFCAANKKLKEVARILRDCLDGHARSRMEMYLALMLRHGLIGDVDLDQFSAELREDLTAFE